LAVRSRARSASFAPTRSTTQSILRLQEPCERGRQAQADPALCGDRCGRARQPGAGRAVGHGATPAMMCSPTVLIGRLRSRPNSGLVVTTSDSYAVGATIRCL